MTRTVRAWIVAAPRSAAWQVATRGSKASRARLRPADKEQVMRPDIAVPRPVLGMIAAGVLAGALSLTGCSSSGKPALTLPTNASIPFTPPTSTSLGSRLGGSLASSKLIGLTKLSKAQLCGTLSASEAAQILGASTSAPTFANRLGLGVTCEWIEPGSTGGSSYGELYVGISTIIDWQGTQAIDKLLSASPTTIDGHPALQADKSAINNYALVHVALGGDHDPVVEFRAPTLAMATKLAQMATPRILAQ
jgi:hypothetical protein